MSGGWGGLARNALKATASVVDRAHRPPRGIVVLAYHRVGGDSAMEVDLPLPLFVEQMETLAATTPVVRLGEALDRLDGVEPGPDDADPVAITFDDGTADFVDAALAVLERLALPVTIYVATDFIESGRSFPHEGRPLSWPMLREAVATGLVDVGSHTHRHLLLDRVDAETAAGELDRSVELIEQQLGVPVSDFAYPKAVAPTPAVDQLVRDRFRSAALAGTRVNPYGQTDPHRLARSPVQVSDGMRWFRRKVAGGLQWEDRVRTIVDRRRLADART